MDFTENSISYANAGFALSFFFILAIFSVVLATTTIVYCLQGSMLASKNRKDAYNVLLFVTIGLNAIFVPAVVSWHWLSVNNEYEGAYRLFGYFGNILLVLIASFMIRKDHLKRSFVFFKVMILCFLYLVICGFVGSAMQTSSGSVMNNLSLLLGVGYASIQLFVPLYYYIQIPENRGEHPTQAIGAVTDISPTTQFVDSTNIQPTPSTNLPTQNVPVDQGAAVIVNENIINRS